MGEKSAIQWTGKTWNPWHGCKKVTAGCDFCYMFRDKTKYGQDPANIHRSAPSTFYAPLKWEVPSMVFTCSWSDWFIKEADLWRDEAWSIIERTPHLIYQVLTKRIGRARKHLPANWGDGWDNVWIGATVEAASVKHRIKQLRETPAKVRFLSIEPLLQDIGELDLTGIHWVIIGGESGNEIGQFLYRECRIEWIENIIRQCREHGVPVFVKQLGTYLHHHLPVKDRHGGIMEEWPVHLQIREFPITKQNPAEEGGRNMTHEVFDNIGFTASTKIGYRGKIYTVRSIDFEEKLIGIDDDSLGAEENDIVWKRCENCSLLV